MAVFLLGKIILVAAGNLKGQAGLSYWSSPSLWSLRKIIKSLGLEAAVIIDVKRGRAALWATDARGGGSEPAGDDAREQEFPFHLWKAGWDVIDILSLKMRKDGGSGTRV